MLSIIISSYQPLYYNQLVKNISETIGDDFSYEIIQIWNPSLMSITKAYNDGAEKAQFDYLLFLHEDVLFHTKNWGEKLISHFNSPEIGIIGVSGSNYVPIAPSSWTVSEEYHFINILETDDKGTTHTQSTKHNKNKVFGVDGVFQAVKKNIFETYKYNFDLKGFHGYDLDFSLRVSNTQQNYTVDNILIEHFSRGNLTKLWLDANIKIRENVKFNKIKNRPSEIERKAFLSFIYKYFEYYPINIKNFFFTFNFYPYNLKLKDHIIILKKYYSYLRYSSTINKKNK